MTTLLIAKNVKYARTASADTVHTALSPEELAPGSIGVYGFANTTTNPNSWVLLTDGGSEAVGKIPAGSFAGTNVMICVGREADKDGNSRAFSSQEIEIKGNNAKFFDVASKAYVAPVLHSWTIGYNLTDGSLNLPSTINKYDDGNIRLTQINSRITAGRSPHNKNSIPVVALDNTDEYSLLNIAITDIDNRTDLKVTPMVVSSTAGSNFANSATASVTKGSKDVTTSAAHGVGANDFIELGFDTYKVTAVPTTTTLTLDRVYKGSTNAALANNQCKDLGTDPGNLGLNLSSTDTTYEFELGADGIFSNSTLFEYRAFKAGVGIPADLKQLETSLIASQGTSDLITSYIPTPKSMVDLTETYDCYNISCTRGDQPTGSTARVFDVRNEVIVAFPSEVADTAGLNQSNFEDVMTSLYSAFPSLF